MSVVPSQPVSRPRLPLDAEHSASSTAPPVAVPSSPSVMLTERVVLLINYIMKHQEPQFRELAKRVPELKLLLSVELEPQRDYRPEHDALDVTIQKTWTIKRKWNHESGFEDQLQVHFPYDTWFQLRRLKPRVIVSYELGARSIISALYRLVHRRTRLVLAVYVSEHTERSWSRWRTWIRHQLLKCADVVTYQGSSGRRYLMSLGVPEDKLMCNPYTAHPAMIYRGPTARPSSKRRRLLFVGQFTQRKAPEKILLQLSNWCHDHPQESVYLSLVGRGPLRDELERGPYPSNLHVNMIGSVAPEQLPEVLADHGILVFPTLADEWGLVVDEALHSGLPVLASIYAQATLDLVEEGVNGWLFRPDEAYDTYQAIDRMLSCDDDTLDQMANAARNSVAVRTPDWGGNLLTRAVHAALEK